MAIKTYGSIYISEDKTSVIIDKAEPHICIRLKHVFPKIKKTDIPPFKFEYTLEHAHDILWFMERYPLSISSSDRIHMKYKSEKFISNINEVEAIFAPDYVPSEVILSDGKVARPYQLAGREFYNKVKRFLLGDDLGLGKTITAILGLCNKDMLPGIVVAPSHLGTHWKDKIEEFTNLKVHIIKNGPVYNLPPADVYISKYSFLYKWVDVFATRIFKQAILDEIQDLRHADTNKYGGAIVLRDNVEMMMGLSATPIYNYGNEIFNIANILQPGCLGSYYDFSREWCGNGKEVNNPKALGTYLREKHIMLRRTRSDVGRELPPINKLIYTVEHDNEEASRAESQARMLAVRTTTGTFFERGRAAMELDVFLRKVTGVSKAKHVAEFVKILLDNGEPVVLAGWHRDVYEIWANHLAEYEPVFYTGTESPKEKDAAKMSFINGDTNLFIISLRSGIGLDGLQFKGKTVVFGELDYSPKVHDQLIARVDRDGQTEQVTAIYLVSEWGSDPVIIDMLGIKSSQSSGVMDPESEIFQTHSDESRIKQFAEKFLINKGIEISSTELAIETKSPERSEDLQQKARAEGNSQNKSM